MAPSPATVASTGFATVGHSSGSQCIGRSFASGSEDDSQQDCGEDLSSGDPATMTDSSYDGEEAGIVVELDMIRMTHDWEGLESGSSDSSTDCPTDDVGRRTRYRNLALAMAAAERTQQEQKPQPCAFGNYFQAATGLVIFAAVNLRVWDSFYACLTLAGYGSQIIRCHLAENRHGLTIWFILFLTTDSLFIVFQIACVYRDRSLRTLRRRLRKAGSYGQLLAVHVYSVVVLGVFSGWQLLRSFRQIKDPDYRDSFLAELNDPAMVNGNAFRMPLYSSHLTFLFELPFVCRVVHAFIRDSLAECDITYFLAWLASFQLVVIAVVTFDYSVSSYVRAQYSSSSGPRFALVHILYRFSECLARSLTVGATMLRVVAECFCYMDLVALVADVTINTLILCCVSKTVSKRVLFLSLPFFGANLALFADESGIAGNSHRVTRVMDIVRAVEMALAAACYLKESAYMRHSKAMVDETYSYRLAICLLLLLVSAAMCWALRCSSLIQIAHADVAADRGNELEQHSKQPCERVENIFGLALNDSFHCQSAESGGFASILFSKGIGDQFASLLEIFWEHDDIRLSRLKAVGKLGEGGFGRVFKVQDTRSGQEYAMKLQRKDRVAAAAVREAEFLHDVCRHPFIVRLERVFRTSAFYGILLELCDGDLNRLILDRERPCGVAEGLPAEEAKHLAACMVVALEHLHARRIVFRDLKPENVLTLASRCAGPGGRDAKLADFGLAKFVGAPTEVCDEDVAESAISHFTAGAGTPAFMCADSSRPEGLEERTPKGVLRLLASRDWYALGCCLMLMLLGERGCRIARAEHRGVLLPPPAGDIHDALRENAGHLPGEDGQALLLLLSLTADSAAERAGAQEVHDSPFMRDAIYQVDLWARGQGV